MRTLLTVFRKEVIDNFRDKRTLASALLMGPLLGPMLFAFVINLSIERSLSDVDKPMDLPVIGAEHAPNLVRYWKVATSSLSTVRRAAKMPSRSSEGDGRCGRYYP